MIERVIHDLLTRSLEALTKHPAALEAFVESLPIDTARERESIRDLVLSFAAQADPVIHGYARADTAFPVWAIVLAADSEDMRALGDEGGAVDGNGDPVPSSLWTRSFQILTYSKHPDVTLYLYELLGAVLLGQRKKLVSAGATQVSNLAGSELAPDQVYLPEFLFVRATTLTVLAERVGIAIPDLDTGEGQPLPVRRVTGLHVRDEGVPPDGVAHRIGTYDE